MKMDDRKIKILQAIINDYINYGEPVGSRTIAKKYDLGISSATIRNEMSDLEEMGFIEQLHSSSGRKPSNKGYRLYVDNLMDLTGLTKEEQQTIDEYLIGMACYEADRIVKVATDILSEMTKLTSFVMAPSVRKSSIKVIQLILVGSHDILATIITDSGIIKHNVLRVNKELDNNAIFALNVILNQYMTGITIEDISSDTLHKLKNEIRGYEDVFDAIFPMLCKELIDSEYEEVYVQGTTNIFNYPEYNNIEKAKEFLSLVDNEAALKNLLNHQASFHDFGGSQLSITIGQENPDESARECSIITATYSYGDKTLGTIGVIGPTRIHYGKVISVLDSIVSEVNKNISRMYNNPK